MDQSKNRKRFYKGGASASKKGKRNRLEPGLKGFIATSSNKDESPCIREVFSLLNEYADRMKNVGEIESSNDEVPDTPTVKEEEEDEDSDDDDLEAALKEECDALTGRDIKPKTEDGTDTSTKESKKIFEKRFVSVDTGVANNIFVALMSDSIDPCALVYSILKDIKSTGQCKSRYIQRLLPIELTCKAYIDDIQKTLMSNQEFMSKHFQPSKSDDDNADPPTYAIFYKCRNNNHLTRDDIFRVVNELVLATNPLAKVDLEKPKKAILIEVLQKVACISIVDDYAEFCKFNLHMVGKP